MKPTLVLSKRAASQKPLCRSISSFVRTKPITALAAALVATAFASNPANAAIFYWDPDQNGANGANGGTGLWTTGSTWSTNYNSSGTSTAWVSGNDAYFYSSASNVTLDASTTAGNLLFNPNGTTISGTNGAILTLTGGSIQSQNSSVSGTNTISANLAGKAFTIENYGNAVGANTRLLLTGSDSFTSGYLIVRNGQLAIGGTGKVIFSSGVGYASIGDYSASSYAGYAGMVDVKDSAVMNWNGGGFIVGAGNSSVGILKITGLPERLHSLPITPPAA